MFLSLGPFFAVSPIEDSLIGKLYLFEVEAPIVKTLQKSKHCQAKTSQQTFKQPAKDNSKPSVYVFLPRSADEQMALPKDNHLPNGYVEILEWDRTMIFDPFLKIKRCDDQKSSLSRIPSSGNLSIAVVMLPLRWVPPKRRASRSSTRITTGGAGSARSGAGSARRRQGWPILGDTMTTEH